MLPKTFSELQNFFSTSTAPVKITGKQNLSLVNLLRVVFRDAPVELALSPEVIQRQQKILHELRLQIEQGQAIYGTTSSYGGQSSRLVTEDPNHHWEKAKQLSQAIIHVDVSTGPEVSSLVTKAALVIRLNMLAPGYSGVRMQILEALTKLINSGYTPIVGSFGSLGASGDLAQNGRIVSCLLHHPSVRVRDKNKQISSASAVLTQLGIESIALDPKEGLGLVNGDNFTTASAALLYYELLLYFYLNLGVSSLTVQALKGSDRNFHPLLSDLRPHYGQQTVAAILRTLLKDSKLSPQEMQGHKVRAKGEDIQDPYSIRCLPQFYGYDCERLEALYETISTNLNSVSDNPLWTTPEHVTSGEEPYQWVSGGNFLAMHMSETLDTLRKISIHLVKQNDRHLARLVHPAFNKGLPANISDPQSISHCIFKGLQTQMGMYDILASLLAAPVTTAFGTHEEFNQDITSHGMTSAHLTQQTVQIVRYALAINLMASCQAVDLRGGPELLSPATQPLYQWVRQRIPYISVEQPLAPYVEDLSQQLLDLNLSNIVTNYVTNSFTQQS